MKKYILGTIAIALAVGFSAYTAPANKKHTQTVYYFEVSNNTSICSQVQFSAFPTQTPPTSITSCGGFSDYCWLGYPDFVKVGNEYRPSLDGSSEATSCQSTVQNLKN